MVSLIVVDWEGGDIRSVGLREWLRFIRTPLEQMALPNPGRPMTAYQGKCFAGIKIGRSYFGYDFIIPRLRKQKGWEIRCCAELRGGVCA